MFVKGVFHHFQVRFVELNSLCIIFGIVVMTVPQGISHSHRADWYTTFAFLDDIEV